MTLPPQNDQPQNPANDDEYVIPDAALPDEQAAPPQYVPPVYAPPTQPTPPAGYAAPPVSGGPYAQQPPGEPHLPPSQKTNVLAIVSLVSAFFISLLAIVLGHISLSQIKKTGEGGRGIALAGTILGYVFSFGWIALIVTAIASVAFISPNLGTIQVELQEQLEQMEETGELPEGFFDGVGPERGPGYEHPGVAAELEPFCDAYWAEFAGGSEDVYLQGLADAAPYAELRAEWQGLADEWRTTANESQASFDAFMNRYLDADDEAWELCS